MKSIGDWIFSQLVSTRSLISDRTSTGTGGFFPERPPGEERVDGANDQTGRSCALAEPLDRSHSPNNEQDSHSHSSLQQDRFEDLYHFHHDSNSEKMDPLMKIEDLQIKFLRLLLRLGLPLENVLVAKVLYRLQLATLIRAGDSDLKRINLRTNKARAIAEEKEAAGQPDLDFSLRVLVLGKTGVGKSATINSVFGQAKTPTDAFQRATTRIKEVVGTVSGIKITFIDTPGLLPHSICNMRRNRKTLFSVKRFIRKSPPDIVLYFDRIDLRNDGYNDFSLLKLITDVFGAELWFNTIFVMTHSSSPFPEGPNGDPLNYESYVNYCTEMVQHYVHQAVSDSKLENPVLLVENHPSCKKNIMGDKILPNGQIWKSQFFLLCICTKVLGDSNNLLKFRDSIELGPSTSTRLPSLPHLLSSLLRHRSVSNPNGVDDEIIEILLSETEEEDDYDKLPPIRILTKSQFERLSDSEKNDYLDELDYRETLYLKKQLKEECERQKENMLHKDQILNNEDSSMDQQEPPEAVLLPDMAIPPSFESDCPVHRYRYLVTSDQWLVRPVLDPQGWDHDVGFDGINLETAVEMRKKVFASIAGQMSKDKHDFNIQSECSAAYVDSNRITYSAGLDVQSAGKELTYTVRSNAKLRKLKHNTADFGLSVTSYGKKCYVGAKLEDSLLVGKRLKFVINAGRMQGAGKVAYGGSLEATLRGADYPARNDHVSMTTTILSFNKDMVLSGSLQSEFRLMRNVRMSVNANLNSRKMGQICIRTSSSEHLGIALISIFSFIKILFRRKSTESINTESEGV